MLRANLKISLVMGVLLVGIHCTIAVGTEPYIIADDMEGYNDRSDIREVWRDGNADVVWGGVESYLYLVKGGSSGSNLNVSSAVGGYGPGGVGPIPPTPFNYEAMVLRYDNDGYIYTGLPGEEEWVYDAPYYSEIEANTVGTNSLGVGRNWSGEGFTSLSMLFQGHPQSDGYIDTSAWPKYTIYARGRDIQGRYDEFYYLSQYPFTGPGFVGVHVLRMDSTDPLAKAGLMIREKWTPYSKHASVFITPSSGITFSFRNSEDGPTISITKPGVTAPQYLRLECLINGAFRANHSDNGFIWYDVNAPGSHPVFPIIPMDSFSDPGIYIGSMVTSGNSGQMCSVDFDKFAVIPYVPNWVLGNIGTNDPERLYVALEDSAGNVGVVRHNDINAATRTTWQKWDIPLTEFTGVNLNSVKKICIGLGDRDAPVQGGSGTLYIDDIRLRRAIFVDADTTAGGNGSSWAQAFNNLQNALATAQPGDEIRVAQGIYKPIAYMPPPPPPPPPFESSNEDESIEPAVDRTATFQLVNGVVIKGGYAGFGEPNPNARDIDTYKTILSGDLLGNDEPNFVNYEENSYHVVTGSGCDETVVLDGFTITAGYANGSGKPDNRGGGMYNNNGSPTIINCTFSKNAAGNAGGMANSDYCSPTLINCTFIGNAVTSSGAGMFDWKSASTLINCDFRGNFGRYGAAARIYDSSVTLTNCTFSGNFARQQGGALYVSYSSIELSNCSFSSNVTTLYYGGGIYNHEGSSSLFLTNCILFDNIDSGGMDESAQIHGGTPVVNYCCIQGWTGNWPGAGNTGSDPMFARNPDDGGDGWGVGNRENFGALLSIGSNDDFGDLNLLLDSPCINAGDPDYIAGPNETDLDGKPRIIGGRIDMGAYEFNHKPVADAGPDRNVEAQAPWGATVTLDGSGSSDADSTPGTIDDIQDFNWYELDPCDPNVDIFLGSGVIIDCNLSIGEHVIILEVIDRAGASDTNEVTIIVQDTTPPDIDCPPDVTLEYPADTSPSATGKATAVDTCGDVTVRCRNRIIPGCGNTETIERTWIATDEYGNESSCVQVITVVDTTPPAISCPADVTLECPADTSVEANGSATAGDTCGTVTIAHSDQWQPGYIKICL